MCCCSISSSGNQQETALCGWPIAEPLCQRAIGLVSNNLKSHPQTQANFQQLIEILSYSFVPWSLIFDFIIVQMLTPKRLECFSPSTCPINASFMFRVEKNTVSLTSMLGICPDASQCNSHFWTRWEKSLPNVLGPLLYTWSVLCSQAVNGALPGLVVSPAPSTLPASAHSAA